MATPADRARDDAERAAKVVDAAARANLGAHRATYLTRVPNKARSVRGTATVVGVSAVAALAAIVWGDGLLACVLGFPGVIALYVLLVLRVGKVPTVSDRLDLFEHGLTCTFSGEVRVARYDDTTVRQDIRQPTYGPREHLYHLVGLDGQRFSVTNRFPDVDVWGAAIQQGVTAARLPPAIATLTAGRRLTFGDQYGNDLWVTAAEVGNDRRSVPWSQVQDIKVKNGWITLKVAGQWFNLTSMVHRIPNFFVFYALAHHLRGTAKPDDQDRNPA